MALELPDVIARYFAADKAGDADTVSLCFTDDAAVRDEGQNHVGRNRIRDWKVNASRQYTYTVEPFSIVHKGDLWTVKSHVVGNFPGSPVDLRYLFALEDEQIAELEIAL